MKRIAVLGGTFNPIHNGHIYLAREFARRLSFDSVLLMPANVPPHKHAEQLAQNGQRLHMCKLAAREDPVLQACGMELARDGASYTCETLRELAKEYPGDALYFITGADMFLTIERWKNAGEIFRLATICAAPRKDLGAAALYEHEKKLRLLGARTVIEPMSPPNVSSTQIRLLASQGKSIAGLVPAAVGEYIISQRLYRPQEGCGNG